MEPLIWIDGKLVPKADAKVSVYDHGLLYGDGVFEGIRSYSGKIFEREPHLRRLYDSAKAIRLKIPYTSDQLSAAMDQTLAANKLRDSYLRVVVTRGTGALGISPQNCNTPSVIIIADTIQLYPPELYKQGMAVITASTIRNHPNSISPKVKSLNYLNNILAKWEAIDAGVPEAIMLNHMGYVCECTADNIFMVRNGALETPPEDSGILVGITRQYVINLARHAGLTVHEKSLTRYDLYTADEVFLTGTGCEIIPITSIDKRPIGPGTPPCPGPLTAQLTQAFHKKVHEQ